VTAVVVVALPVVAVVVVLTAPADVGIDDGFCGTAIDTVVAVVAKARPAVAG